MMLVLEVQVHQVKGMQVVDLTLLVEKLEAVAEELLL